MSREIDPDNLSEDDKAYIAQRPLLRQEIMLEGYDDPLEGYEYDPFGQKAARRDATRVRGSSTVTEDVREPGNDDEEGTAWNKSMPKRELQDVIDRRNEGRAEDDKIVVEGDLKDDLIAALEDDDNE